MLEEAAHNLKDVKAGGAWSGTSWFARGAGDDAVLEADNAAVGDGDFEDVGCEVCEGIGATRVGLAVDVPWGVPDVWIDLFKCPGFCHLLLEDGAVDRRQGAYGDREVGSRRQPCVALL